MNPLTLLDRYTQAVEDRDRHIEANKAVFDTHQQIVMRIIDAENDLRDIISQTKEGVENGSYKVIVTPQTQVAYDEEKILLNLGVTRETAVGKGIITDQERPARVVIRKI